MLPSVASQISSDGSVSINILMVLFIEDLENTEVKIIRKTGTLININIRRPEKDGLKIQAKKKRGDKKYTLCYIGFQ